MSDLRFTKKGYIEKCLISKLERKSASWLNLGATDFSKCKEIVFDSSTVFCLSTEQEPLNVKVVKVLKTLQIEIDCDKSDSVWYIFVK